MAERIYLCARYSRHVELAAYADELRALGYSVDCEWISGAHDDTDSATCATIDLSEVLSADTVISFTEGAGEIQGRGRGGRHVEFGIALAAGKQCVVVGHRENVFHHLPAVVFYPDWATCLQAMRLTS